MRGSAAKKTDTLRALFSPAGQCADMCHLACPCPLDPSIHLLGVIPEQCSVFKSALSPLRLAFKVQLPQPAAASPTAVAAAAAGGLAAVSSAGSLASAGGGEGGPSQQQSEGWEVAERLPSLTLSSPNASRRGSSQGQGQGQGQGGEGPHLSRRPSSNATHRTASAGGEDPSVGSPFAATSRRTSLQRTGTDALLRAASVQAAAPPSTLTLIYKKGDDLRQDQLVVQMFSLMDRWGTQDRRWGSGVLLWARFSSCPFDVLLRELEVNCWQARRSGSWTGGEE